MALEAVPFMGTLNLILSIAPGTVGKNKETSGCAQNKRRDLSTLSRTTDANLDCVFSVFLTRRF